MRVVCAWCDDDIVPGEGTIISHGLCLRCHPRVTDCALQRVTGLEREVLDALPYGLVALDANNQILSYNRAESERARRHPDEVIGKNFFMDVAPCTNVRELAGWLADARAAGRNAKKTLEFVFEFPFGRELVDIRLLYEAETETSTILVKSINGSKAV